MNAARQFIESIADGMADAPTPLKGIRHVLEDGAALELLGVTDAEQETVEEAHALVCAWIKSGIDNLEEV